MNIVALIYHPGESAMYYRALSLFKNFSKKQNTSIIVRKSNNFIDTFRFFFLSLQKNPDVIILYDQGLPSVIASFLIKIIRFGKVQIIQDTGDLVYLANKLYELMPNRLLLWMVYLADKYSYKISDKIIVRGSYHKIYLEKHGYKNVYFLPDGVDLDFFKPMNASKLRKKLRLDDNLVVGIMATMHYLPKYDMTNYGWGLIEALAKMKDKPIKGLVVGGGPGIDKLKEKARKYMIEDKITFTGKVKFEKLPQYINAMDVCLLTQPRHLTTDARTTAKLPTYLACGKFIITSPCWEANKVIADNGFILPYKGFKDLDYPYRLTEKLNLILKNKSILKKGLKGVKIAKKMYTYNMLGKRLENIINNN